VDGIIVDNYVHPKASPKFLENLCDRNSKICISTIIKWPLGGTTAVNNRKLVNGIYIF